MSDSAGTKKILILDDEQDIVTYLETLLQDHGYETVTAMDGKSGMEAMKSQKPDLVTLDISMPEKSGVRFYRDAKEDPQLADVPIVIVTGVTGYGADPDSFQRFISSRTQVPPPAGFVAKPIDQDQLLGTIKELIG